MYKDFKSAIFNVIPDGPSDLIYIGMIILLVAGWFTKNIMRSLYIVLGVGLVIAGIDFLVLGVSFQAALTEFAHFVIMPVVVTLFMKKTRI